MTPLTFIQAGERLFGRKEWKREMARRLGVNYATITRIIKREEIPGPVQTAVAYMLSEKKRADEAVREARKLIPHGLRRRTDIQRKVKRKKKFAVKRARPRKKPLTEILKEMDDGGTRLGGTEQVDARNVPGAGKGHVDPEPGGQVDVDEDVGGSLPESDR
jgi:hypothetical protein